MDSLISKAGVPSAVFTFENPSPNPPGPANKSIIGIGSFMLKKDLVFAGYEQKCLAHLTTSPHHFLHFARARLAFFEVNGFCAANLRLLATSQSSSTNSGFSIEWSHVHSVFASQISKHLSPPLTSELLSEAGNKRRIPKNVPQPSNLKAISREKVERLSGKVKPGITWIPGFMDALEMGRIGEKIDPSCPLSGRRGERDAWPCPNRHAR